MIFGEKSVEQIHGQFQATTELEFTQESMPDILQEKRIGFMWTEFAIFNN